MGIIDVHAPKPVKGSLKRSLEALDPESVPTSKRRRSQPRVCDWLSNVDVDAAPTRVQSVPAVFSNSKILPAICERAPSVPAKFDSDKLPPTIEDLVEVSRSPAPIDEMGDRRDRDREDGSFSQSSTKTTLTKIKPSNTAYQEVLEYNNVYIDRTGLEMSPNVRDFVNATILKPRTSPPLAPDLLNQTVTSMEKWGNTTEGVINNFATTPMWPVHQPSIGLGGNSAWARDALPFDPTWGYPLSTPIPDHVVGYARGRKSGFSREEMHVASHPFARSYTQPATGIFMPFLVAELKPNVTSGTTWRAQNQAAGSGTYCVNALEWLFDQAKIPKTETDTLSFSLTANGSVVTISVHWRSKEHQAYYMSHVKGFIPTEIQGVQECHNVVKNIVEWSLGIRHKKLKDALETLFPLPEHWMRKRTADDAQFDNDKEVEVEEQPLPAASFTSHMSMDSRASGTHQSLRRASSATTPPGVVNYLKATKGPRATKGLEAPKNSSPSGDKKSLRR